MGFVFEIRRGSGARASPCEKKRQPNFGFSRNSPEGPVAEGTKKSVGYPNPANRSNSSAPKRMKTGRTRAATQRNTFCFLTDRAGVRVAAALRGVSGFPFLLIQGPWMLVVGCWSLVVGYWLLDIGCSMLDVGCSMLDVGCSMLDILLSFEP